MVSSYIASNEAARTAGMGAAQQSEEMSKYETCRRMLQDFGFQSASVASCEKFESKVKPGGILIYDNYGIHRAPTRKDIKVYNVAAMDATLEMKNSKTYNMIVLGALLKVCPMVTLESVIKGLKKSLPERHHKLIPLNEEAIRKGMSLNNE